MSKHQTYKLAGVTLLLGLAFLPRAYAAHTFIAVLNNPQSPKSSATHGYAKLTLGDDDRLCYSVSLRGEVSPSLEIRFLHGGLSREMDRTSHVLAGPTAAAASGCLGPLSTEEKRDLLNQEFYLHLLGDAFPGGEIGGSAARVRAAVSSETEAWLGLAQLLDLDERQWGLLQRMVRFVPSDWERLNASLRDRARGEASQGLGRRQPIATVPVAPLPGSTAIDFDVLNFDDLVAELSEVTSLVEEIRDFVTTLGADGSKLSALKGINLPRGLGTQTIDPSFTNLNVNEAIEKMDELIRKAQGSVAVIDNWVQEIQNSPLVGALEELQPQLLENIDDTLDTLSFFKNAFAVSFDQFVAPDNCGPGSPCGLFKLDLRNILTQLKTLAGDTPGLVGLETDFPIQTDLLDQFVAHTPPLALFLVKSIADELLPQWRSLFEEIPALAGALQGGAAPLSAVEPQMHRNPVDHLCVGVSKKEEQLDRLLGILGLVNGLLEFVSETLCPNTFVIGLTVAAGATANPVAHPCKAHTEFNKNLVRFIGDVLSNFQERCFIAQQRAVSIYEPHLQECNQLVGLFVPVENGGHLEELRNLIEFRSLQTGKPELDNYMQALHDYDDSFAQGRFRVAYCCLCKAYGEILTANGGTSNACECP